MLDPERDRIYLKFRSVRQLLAGAKMALRVAKISRHPHVWRADAGAYLREVLDRIHRGDV